MEEKRFTLRMDGELFEEVSKYAKEHRRSTAKEIEFAVAKYLRDIKKEDILAPFVLTPLRTDEFRGEPTEEEAREALKKLMELEKKYILNKFQQD